MRSVVFQSALDLLGEHEPLFLPLQGGKVLAAPVGSILPLIRTLFDLFNLVGGVVRTGDCGCRRLMLQALPIWREPPAPAPSGRAVKECLRWRKSYAATTAFLMSTCRRGLMRHCGPIRRTGWHRWRFSRVLGLAACFRAIWVSEKRSRRWA